MFKKENRKARRRANVFIFCFCVAWLIVSYCFILQPIYKLPVEEANKKYVSFSSDDENSYLEELEDGSYLFHYAGFTEKVSKEDVKNGMYKIYPIIKYEKK